MEHLIFSTVNKDEDRLYRDITGRRKENEFEFWPSHRILGNFILKMAEQISLSYRLNIRIPVTGKIFFYNLHRYPYNEQDEYYIVLTTLSISKMSVKYLKSLKKRHANIKLIALLIDSIMSDSEHLNLVRNKLKSDVWDCVLTYDKYDAERFGYVWFGYTYYSKVEGCDVPVDDGTSDLYYIGKRKGAREKLFADVYTYLTKQGVDCRFYIWDRNSKEDESVCDSKLKYVQKAIPYEKVISQVKSANCILEVLQMNQGAQTIRYFEAIVYNKKLLTNNPHISELPYYDPNRMRYFSKPEEIDIEWVKEPAEFDYHYHEEFSPIYLAEFVKSYFKMKRR